MYDPADMMSVFAICVALAGIAYLRQLFAATELSALHNSALEYSIYGDLILPTDFYAWIYVQLTDASLHNPVDFDMVMNYPDAYIAPSAYEHFLSTHTLPDGIIAFKRIVGRSAITSSGLADQSCRPCSVPSDIERANVAVKDRLQFGENHGWGFFRLNQHELNGLRRKTLNVRPPKHDDSNRSNDAQEGRDARVLGVVHRQTRDVTGHAGKSCVLFPESNPCFEN
ncbi:hypothetical protein FAZ95_27130 [Trinickia violacea]|uniref:Uncharacterized protein n=1 Tax=Trinickia violacea TaxID=2571746 RepID=A0A4P8IWI9_9BURK|nr:hypothetical protein [Trinickia violacea]QCP52806.1 hypothetical protein FAZ95_27130 [Trinickia violacea]